jgi:putative lipoprotein
MVAVVLAVVLAGCGPAAPAVPDEPDDAATTTTATATPTDVTTATPTPTADATGTATPTDATTATPTPTADATGADESDTTPTATPADDDAAAATSELAGTTWQWVEFQDTAGQNSYTLDEPENYMLFFDDDGTISIQADCNVVRGTYTTENGGMSITFGSMTLAECGPNSRYVPYIRGLRDVASYVLAEDQLFLNLPVDSGNLVFEPAASADTDTATNTPELVGPTWQWVEFQDVATGQNNYTLDEPENYILFFDDDGTVSIQADCNRASGTYTAEDGGLSITLGPMTLAECGPDSRYDTYLNWLGDVVSYVVEDDQLFLNLPVDSGNLVFEPIGTENDTEASTTQVTGTVTYRPRIALPPDAVITVQIQDVSLADATAEIIGEQVIQAEGQQVPFAYAVSYDPDEIQPNDRYSMSARIEDGEGMLLFTSDTNIPVITEGNPTSAVEIVVQQAARQNE